MDAVGPKSRGQRAIQAHHQDDAATASRRADTFAARQGVGRAERAEDHRRATRQARHDPFGNGRAGWFGEEQQRRQGLCSAASSS
jgi:hypothetical protein